MSLLKLTIFYRNRKKSCFLYLSQFFNLWHITFILSCFNTRYSLIKFMSNEHMKRKENQKACSCPLVSQWLQWKAFEAWLTARTSLQWCSETPMMLWRKDLADLNLLSGISPNPHRLVVKSIISLQSSTIYLSSEKSQGVKLQYLYIIN